MSIRVSLRCVTGNTQRYREEEMNVYITGTVNKMLVEERVDV